MTRFKIPPGIFIAAVVLVAAAAGVAAIRSGRLPWGQQREAGVYYCPMHPSYTSDRPGSCPICNMQLVKREAEPAAAPAAAPAQPAKSTGDVCHLHNCPMAHTGQPCPMLVVSKPGEEVVCPICGKHVAEAEEPPEHAVLYWTDPMMPGYRSDKPGTSPMGMELIPVYAEAGLTGGPPAAEGYTPILVSPQKQQLIGVKTARAQRQSLTKTIRTVGRVTVDETRIVRVNPKVEGWVEEVFAKYAGDAVTNGQPLFSFYSPDFVQTQEEYLAARRTLDGLAPNAGPELLATALSNVAAARQRLLWWDVTEEQVQQLEQRGMPSKTLTLTSPIDGVVLAKEVFPGQFMERGAKFYELADLSTVWVDADLYESDPSLVGIGQEVAILPAEGQELPELRGKVVYVSPVVNPQTRTATARVELANPGNVLKPGRFVTAQLTVELGQRLVIPAEAVLSTGTRHVVFVDKGQGLFEPRDVTVGAKSEGRVEVVSGVADGDAIVVSSQFLIDSESRLKAALEGFGTEGHQHGQ